MIISIIVAADLHNGIGVDNGLLWQIPADMLYFKTITSGHHVLMGKNTYLSIPDKYRPLSERTNIVISKDSSFENEGAKVFSTIEEGINFAKANEETELMIIGGGKIYEAAMHFVKRIYLTRVNHTFPLADTFFPFMEKHKWHLKTSRLQLKNESTNYDLMFEVWEK